MQPVPQHIEQLALRVFILFPIHDATQSIRPDEGGFRFQRLCVFVADEVLCPRVSQEWRLRNGVPMTLVAVFAAAVFRESARAPAADRHRHLQSRMILLQRGNALQARFRRIGEDDRAILHRGRTRRSAHRSCRRPNCPLPCARRRSRRCDLPAPASVLRWRGKQRGENPPCALQHSIMFTASRPRDVSLYSSRMSGSVAHGLDTLSSETRCLPPPRSASLRGD